MMIEFVRTHFSFLYIGLYSLAAVLGLLSFGFFEMDIEKIGIFLINFALIFLTNLIAPFILVLYLFKIIKKVLGQPDLKFSKFFITSLAGYIYCGLTLLPVLIIFLLVSSQSLDLSQENLVHSNILLNILYTPIYFILSLYMLSALSLVYLRMEPQFSIKEAIKIYQSEHFMKLIYLSPFYFILPMIFRFISLNWTDKPQWFIYVNFVFSQVGVLAIVFTLCYLVEIRRRSSS